MVPSLLTSEHFARHSNGKAFLPRKSLPGEQLDECRNLYLEGKSEHSKQNYTTAVRYFLKAVYLQEVLLGKYHQDTIKTYWRLGKAACMAKQDSQAIEAFHRAARCAEITFEDTIVKSLLNDVETTWEESSSENLTEKESSMTATKAPTATTASSTSFSSSTSTDSPLDDLNKLLALEKAADAACKKRHFDKAITTYQDALDLLTKMTGSVDTLDGADLQVKQSTCYMRISNIDNALQILVAAHECYVRKLGEDHPATLGAAANLTTLHSMKEKQEKEGSNNNSGKNSNGGSDSKKGLWWNASMSSLGSSSKEGSAPCTASTNPSN